MILADKIINERKKNGWSQEELADMMDVSRQSVSKWEGAQSVPDLQKILKLAEIFGVSTDYLLKDDMEPESKDVVSTYENNKTESTLRSLSLEEASEFISLRKNILPVIAVGVILCITCPLMLIFLSGMTNCDAVNISQNTATLVGLLFLFLHLAVAVFIFVTKSGKLKKYEFIQTDSFETGYGVDGMVKEKMAAEESSNTMTLAIGVLLCLLSPVPIVITSVIGAPNFVITSMVCLLLLMIATAVFLFVSKTAVFATYKMLLQVEDYTKENKIKDKKLSAFPGIYWMSITFIFLGISFWTKRWDLTWIIWAVSGVLFGLIMAIAKAFVKAD
jgi:transcriptional regulator with XRE-family HTH domain